MEYESVAGLAAEIGFGIGLLVALAAMFWGLNFVPVILVLPALIGCLVLPLAMSWAFYWAAMRL